MVPDRLRTNGRDNTYAFMNLTTALASDQVWFNSVHHRERLLRRLSSLDEAHAEAACRPQLAERIGAKSPSHASGA